MRDAKWRKEVSLRRYRLQLNLIKAQGGFAFFPALAIAELMKDMHRAD